MIRSLITKANAIPNYGTESPQNQIYEKCINYISKMSLKHMIKAQQIFHTKSYLFILKNIHKQITFREFIRLD